jgi:hypothetical protein
MEINNFDQVIGGITQADTVEGRFVIMVANAMTGTFININSDLPGLRVPATAEEAKRAKFVLAFAVDNRQSPIVNYPTAPTFDTRGGWGGNTTHGPLTGLTMWLTHPENQEGNTVVSGLKALGYTEGTFTFPSGEYVDSAAIKVPGCAIMVADTASDGAGSAGKPKAQTSLAVGAIGFTETFDSATGRLTIRVE